MKQHKRDWHNAMRPRAALYVGWLCQRCAKRPDDGQDVIHHITYPKNWWTYDVEFCIDVGVCVYLCWPCHREVHKNGALKPCDLCGADTVHGLQRSRTLGMADGLSICRDCMNRLRAPVANEAMISQVEVSSGETTELLLHEASWHPLGGWVFGAPAPKYIPKWVVRKVEETWAERGWQGAAAEGLQFLVKGQHYMYKAFPSTTGGFVNLHRQALP